MLSPSTLVAASLHHVRETLHILAPIRHVEGWRGFFGGFGQRVTGVALSSAIKFYTYSNSKRLASKAFGCTEDVAAVNITVAAAAGAVTSTATNPIWLIKTR